MTIPPICSPVRSHTEVPHVHWVVLDPPCDSWKSNRVVWNTCLKTETNKSLACLCCELCQHSANQYVSSWYIPIFQHCNRKQYHRSPLQLCTAHCWSLIKFFGAVASMKQLMNHNIIWAAWPWRTSLRDCTFCVFFRIRVDGMPAGTSSEEVGLLGTHCSSCSDVTARVFSLSFPLSFTFLFLSCRDWTMWYFAACQANWMSHSRKEHSHVILPYLAVMCIKWGWLTTMSCLWWSFALLHRSSRPSFALQCYSWTHSSFNNQIQTTLLPQTISCSTAFFSKIQQGFMLQSHLSQSATQGYYLLWSVNQDPRRAKKYANIRFSIDTSSSRASRGRKFQKKKVVYSKERICL